MSKRTQSIRSMFAGGNDQTASNDAQQPVQRVASGAVRSLKDTFSEVERHYEELKQQVADGAVPVEIDPELVDPSPFADRFADQDMAVLEVLKTSIKDHGQEIPILVRPHPAEIGRYQVAYGHRRLRATAELGLKVKAYVRELDDDRLVVAQGIENSAREDLTFIERAAFALKLDEGGFQRSLIQMALSVDRHEAQKLVTVARAVPQWLIDSIGRAPKIGRPRWLELAELLKVPGAEKKARKATQDKSFSHKDSDNRFLVVLRASKIDDVTASSVAPTRLVAKSADGLQIATLAIGGKQCKIEMNRDRDETFAKFVMEQLPALYANFRKENPSSEG
ncbi:plasmid partitioning protein RepB [Agrobacterium tumefaciens]|uniref:Riorf133 protein n=2 Tax=Rhizobium/Agrobacterium group TaxID=227290 RepID=Q9F5B9_RHIRH|nr:MULTISPECIES: plasmid partitioning protein RepB [Rhizobium/Agrobacterium group]ASK43021.1 plasmid partitioning protein RepB [Rhizobium rhizogenes]MCZ7976351.1 plasmid partitioning protein RepB [Agrobacterium salinitolerans]MDA5243239.1 plasmid partitioning protein RepB [Agrobacterium sp. MAFF310724]MDA5247579.1 plasmid partitioning protein RepB [Agrobacterium sp. MAFF210268]TRB03254.1 plasmid partitioning protein RepB [Agrobacterium tumefaciens]